MSNMTELINRIEKSLREAARHFYAEYGNEGGTTEVRGARSAVMQGHHELLGQLEDLRKNDEIDDGYIERFAVAVRTATGMYNKVDAYLRVRPFDGNNQEHLKAERVLIDFGHLHLECQGAFEKAQKINNL